MQKYSETTHFEIFELIREEVMFELAYLNDHKHGVQMGDFSAALDYYRCKLLSRTQHFQLRSDVKSKATFT